jgi:hypothetical protein
MNPAYRHARFRAEIPHGGMPDAFGVVTACNPNGKTIADAENISRTEAFREKLETLGLEHFPVTGYDPLTPHEEAGFGVVCDPETALAFGREWEQEAIFWVQLGQVTLVSCSEDSEESPLGAWSDMAD